MCIVWIKFKRFYAKYAEFLRFINIKIDNTGNWKFNEKPVEPVIKPKFEVHNIIFKIVL